MDSKWKASFVSPCWFTNIEIIVTSRALLPSQPSCHWYQNSVWGWSHQPWHRHCWCNACKLYPFITKSLWWKGMHLQLTFPYPLSWSSHLFLINACHMVQEEFLTKFAKNWEPFNTANQNVHKKYRSMKWWTCGICWQCAQFHFQLFKVNQTGWWYRTSASIQERDSSNWFSCRSLFRGNKWTYILPENEEEWASIPEPELHKDKEFCRLFSSI